MDGEPLNGADACTGEATLDDRDTVTAEDDTGVPVLVAGLGATVGAE